MQGFGEAIGSIINGLMILCIIFVPLGLWKLIEIIIWIFHHVYIGVN